MSDWIEAWDPAVDGELNERNMRRKLEARGYRVNRYVYSPGACFPPHRHEIDKIDGVLAGRLRVTMRGQTLELTAGDCLAVPRGEMHSAEVAGYAPVISLDAVRID